VGSTISEIELVKYTPEMKEIWDSFVMKDSNEGTIFHTITFLSYHGDKFKENEYNLMFYKGKDRRNLIGVMPLGIFKEDGKTVVKTPYGASFGGLVSKPFTPLRYYVQMVDKLLKLLSELNVDIIYVVPPPYIYSKIYSNYFEFVMFAKGFELFDRRITSVVDLSTFREDPFEIIKKKERNSIRKAIKSGVEIKEDIKNIDDIKAFYNILLQNKRYHNAKPTHTLNEILTLKKLLPKNIKIDLAYYGGEPIAGIMYIICNSRVVLVFYICHYKDFSKLNAVSLLIYHGLKWAKKSGFRYVDFGRSANKYNYTTNTVLFFKENFGSVGVFRDYYYLELNK